MSSSTPHQRELEAMAQEQEQVITEGRWIAIIDETMKAIELKEKVKAERIAAERAALELALEGRSSNMPELAIDPDTLPPLPEPEQPFDEKATTFVDHESLLDQGMDLAA